MPYPTWYTADVESGRFILDSAHEWPESSEGYDYDPSWYNRERNRFFALDSKGEIYRSLPDEWQTLPHIPGHFTHYSVKHPGMVAYTASYAHGVADRQTVMKPGRYLGKFYPSLSAPEIARFASMVSAIAKPIEVQWARTSDEIASAYLDGPNSCMSHPTRDYETGGTHPTEVYATPDIGLAYLYGDNNRIVARTLVRFRDNQPKYWVRIYGDELRMEIALSSLGVEKCSRALDGARLLLIETDDGNIVCPWLDGSCSYVTVNGDYLRIGSSGDHCACTTSGIIACDDRDSCGNCGDQFDEDDLTYLDDAEESWCNRCIRNNYTWSNYEDRWIQDDDAITAYHLNYAGRRREIIISRNTLDGGDFCECELSGNIVHVDLAVELVNQGVTNRDWHTWADRDEIDPDEYSPCGDDPGCYYHLDDMVEIDGLMFWKHGATARGHSPTVHDPRQITMEEVA